MKSLTEKLSDFSDIVCIESTSDFENATNSILKEKPDILFLDLDSDGYYPTSFNFVNELLQYIETLPQIIGVSRDKIYAYESFKCDFTDYLLKPLKESELRKSITRIKKKLNKKTSKVCFKSYSDYHIFNSDEVVYLKADNNTTDIFLTNGLKITAFENLKSFEAQLSKDFARIHNSYMVNVNLIRRINFGKLKISVMRDAEIINIPFSRSYKTKVEIMKSEVFNSTLN